MTWIEARQKDEEKTRKEEKKGGELEMEKI